MTYQQSLEYAKRKFSAVNLSYTACMLSRSMFPSAKVPYSDCGAIAMRAVDGDNTNDLEASRGDFSQCSKRSSV